MTDISETQKICANKGKSLKKNGQNHRHIHFAKTESWEDGKSDQKPVMRLNIQ